MINEEIQDESISLGTKRYIIVKNKWGKYTSQIVHFEDDQHEERYIAKVNSTGDGRKVVGVHDYVIDKKPGQKLYDAMVVILDSIEQRPRTALAYTKDFMETMDTWVPLIEQLEDQDTGYLFWAEHLLLETKNLEDLETLIENERNKE